MKKSRMWNLAMALATAMSGAASSDKEDEDLSRYEEMASVKTGPASAKDQSVRPVFKSPVIEEAHIKLQPRGLQVTPQ